VSNRKEGLCSKVREKRKWKGIERTKRKDKKKQGKEGVVVCSNDGDSTQEHIEYDMRRAFRRHAL
jgi:galactose-1-phosphate uridylyltransferase